MKLLAIETSCDETGVAVVEGAKTPAGFSFEVLGSALLSQAPLHAPYGGVYPNLAKREHQKNLPVILAEALQKAQPKLARKNSLVEAKGRPEDFFSASFGEGVDAIAVTSGPGLEPALWTGIAFAQELAQKWGKPLFAANHMEGHLLSSLAQPSGERSYILENVRMPVLALLISGGHTEFVLMRDWFSYQVVGETLDDAVGEAFDKVARMLGLPYPGGPEISKLATAHRAKQKDHEKSLVEAGGRPEDFSKDFSAKLPRPMLNSGTCDFSFSGIKTAALYALRDRGGIQTLSADEIAAFAAEFEEAVAEVFVQKTRQALVETGAATFVIGGGVAANRYIREELQKMVLDEFPDVEYRLPHLSITGDNAIMIAGAALCHLLTGDWHEPPSEIKAVGSLSIAQKML